MNWNYTNGAIKAQIAAAAKKAENNARAETVRQSAAEAAAARKAAANKVRKNRETVNEAFKKAAAKKAAENARKKKEAAENIKKNLNALSKRTNITKNIRLNEGKKIYRKGSMILHPNKGGTTEAFQILSGAYNQFKIKVNQN